MSVVCPGDPSQNMTPCNERLRPCGTGKSHIAQAIGHCAVRQVIDVMFTSQTRLLTQINAARATDTLERKLQALARVPLLIIDDFGLRPLKIGQDEDLHELIAERYETNSTIITSNLDFTEWGLSLIHI